MLSIFQFPLVVGRQQIKENNTSFFPIARCISMESESRHRSLGRCEPVKIKEMVSNVIGDVIPNINRISVVLVSNVIGHVIPNIKWLCHLKCWYCWDEPMNHQQFHLKECRASFFCISIARSSDAGEEHLEREVRVWVPIFTPGPAKYLPKSLALNLKLGMT